MAANQYFQLTIANAFSNLNTIYTEDVAAGNTLASTLEFQIRNTSGENLSFKPLTGDPTEQNHHFKLQFWADTLGDMTTGNTSPGKLNPESSFGFRMSAVTPNSLGGYNYYFIAEDTNSPWLPNQTITLELSRFLAKPPSGSNWQATKQISLDGQNLLDASSKLISASQSSLSSNIVVSTILNNVPLPLHLSLLDLDTLPGAGTPGTGASVLNNGTANDLILSVVNMALPDDGSLTTNGVLKFDKNSRLAISFDVQGSNETKNWAIGKADDLSPIAPSFPSDWAKDNAQEESTGNGRITWTFKPASDQGTSLNSLEEMLITIPGIKTMHPSGIANLYFSYQNVPNYGNGSFMVPVQKSPLVTRGQSVGIGTSIPGATLDVRGDTNNSGALTIGGDLTANGNNFKVNGANGLRVEHKVSIGGADVFELDATGIPGGRLKVDTAGNVGIGTPSPSKKLEVNGDALINNSLTVIGTTELKGNLTVDGNMSIPGQTLNFGSTVREMINLWGGTYGIGIQTSTLYMRTAGNFNIYQAGVFSESTNDPGTGGKALLSIDESGNTTIPGNLTVDGTMNLDGALNAGGKPAFEFEVFSFDMNYNANYGNQNMRDIKNLFDGSENNNINGSAWVNTKRSRVDYIGIVVGWQIQNMDLSDGDRYTWTVSMGIPNDTWFPNDPNIWIHISAGVDEWKKTDPPMRAVIQAIFIRKSLVSMITGEASV